MGQAGNSTPPIMNNAAANNYGYNQSTGTYDNSSNEQNQMINQQMNSINLERTPATALMGFPNSVRQVTNTTTNQTEYLQTRMITVELKSNEHGYGINLNDSDGVVRIQGSRPNPDGTPSPSMQNPNIQQGDVIYRVANVVLGSNKPLDVVMSSVFL